LEAIHFLLKYSPVSTVNFRPQNEVRPSHAYAKCIFPTRTPFRKS